MTKSEIKIEVLKELTIMLLEKNHNGEELGLRFETSKDSVARSKDIRAFLYDLFSDIDEMEYDQNEVQRYFSMFDHEIRNNISIADENMEDYEEYEDLTREELNEISIMLYEVTSHYRINLKDETTSEKAMKYAERLEIMAKGFLEREPE